MSGASVRVGLGGFSAHLLADVIPVRVWTKLIAQNPSKAFSVDIDGQRRVARAVAVCDLPHLPYGGSALDGKIFSVLFYKTKKEILERGRWSFVWNTHVGGTGLNYYELNYHKVILLAKSITFKKFTFC
jgi:hypothetical protein